MPVFSIIYSYSMPVCSIVKLLPQGALDDLIRSSTVPSGNSLAILQPGMK